MDSRARNTASAQKRKSYGLLSHAAFLWDRGSASQIDLVRGLRAGWAQLLCPRLYVAPAFSHYTPPPPGRSRWQTQSVNRFLLLIWGLRRPDAIRSTVRPDHLLVLASTLGYGTRVNVRLGVISGHGRADLELSTLPLKADIARRGCQRPPCANDKHQAWLVRACRRCRLSF
jgi:hypothetical protein